MTIVSHSRRFIFIKTFKTAGSSLEVALTKYCDKDDVLAPLDDDEEALRRARYGRGAQNFEHELDLRKPVAALRQAVRGRRPVAVHEHETAFQLRARLGEEVWNSYFKFTVVRHPFDRCVSRYFYSRKHMNHRFKNSFWNGDDIGQYLHYNAAHINENWKMYTYRDQPIVDFLVRYEHLREDLAVVSERLGLGENIHDEMQSIRAKADLRPEGAQANAVLDERQRMLIALLCAEEMALVGYEAASVTREPEPA